MADIDDAVVPRQGNVASRLQRAKADPRKPGKDYSTHRLLIGTHTSGADQNYLQIADVQLPISSVELSNYDDDRGEFGGYAGLECRLSITQKIVHEGEVNRARYQPQNPDIIATMSVSGDVLIFDRTKHPNSPTSNDCKPDIRLRGHAAEGYFVPPYFLIVDMACLGIPINLAIS